MSVRRKAQLISLDTAYTKNICVQNHYRQSTGWRCDTNQHIQMGEEGQRTTPYVFDSPLNRVRSTQNRWFRVRHIHRLLMQGLLVGLGLRLKTRLKFLRQMCKGLLKRFERGDNISLHRLIIKHTRTDLEISFLIFLIFFFVIFICEAFLARPNDGSVLVEQHQVYITRKPEHKLHNSALQLYVSCYSYFLFYFVLRQFYFFPFRIQQH
jgi:hypothetical protein